MVLRRRYEKTDSEMFHLTTTFGPALLTATIATWSPYFLIVSYKRKLKCADDRNIFRLSLKSMEMNSCCVRNKTTITLVSVRLTQTSNALKQMSVSMETQAMETKRR